MRPPDRHEDDRLSAFLDDELREDQALEVTRHLASCARCLDELEAVRATRDALRSLPPLAAPPVVLTASAQSSFARWGKGPAVMGLVSLVALIAFLAGAERGGDVAPPIDVYVVDHVVRVGGDPVMSPVNLSR